MDFASRPHTAPPTLLPACTQNPSRRRPRHLLRVILVADFGGKAEEGGGLAGTSGSVVGMVAHFGVSNAIIGYFCNPLTSTENQNNLVQIDAESEQQQPTY